MIRTVVAVALLVVAPPVARAQLIAYEPFNYSSGTALAGQSGGQGFTGAWNGGQFANGTIAAPGLSFGALDTAGNAVTTQNANGGNFRVIAGLGFGGIGSGTIYLSLLVNGANSSGGTAGLSLFNGATESLTIGRQLSNFYTVSQGTDIRPTTVSATDATTHLLVARIDFGIPAPLGRLRLYVDPTPGGAEPASAAIDYTPASFVNFDRLGFQAGNGTLLVDEVRLGRSFAAVTPVPEPAGLLALGAALGGAGWRRARRTSERGTAASLAGQV